MIGELPESVTLSNGKTLQLSTDFRVVLSILAAFEDPELRPETCLELMLELLYEDYEKITADEIEECLILARDFIDGVNADAVADADVNAVADAKRIISWTQDEKMIFSAVNAVARKDIRTEPYLHWWTFLSYFGAVGDCLLTAVVRIRQKINDKGLNGLESYEKEFYKENQKLVKIQNIKEREQERRDKEAIFKKLGIK